MGGAATASSAMYFAFRCAAVGESNSASGIAINSDTIGIAKARTRLMAAAGHMTNPPILERMAEMLAWKPSSRKG
jgi:hypothetical protein